MEPVPAVANQPTPDEAIGAWELRAARAYAEIDIQDIGLGRLIRLRDVVWPFSRVVKRESLTTEHGIPPKWRPICSVDYS